MRPKLYKKTKVGFTLVEIMIVVAIIAVLASLALPNFLRSRKRSQATRVLEDLRILDGAIDLYAIEHNKQGGFTLTFTDLQAYMKANSTLYLSNNKDVFGNTYNGGTFTVDGVPKLSSTTYTSLSDIVPPEFWSPYR